MKRTHRKNERQLEIPNRPMNKEDLIAALLDARRLSRVAGGGELPLNSCGCYNLDPSI